MAVLNSWRQTGTGGSGGGQLYAFLSCDFCLPPRALPGTAAMLRGVGWRFDDFERGPHRCPACPPRSLSAQRLRTSPPSQSPALPNVIIIGAAKAGTTAIHDYLELHPDVAMAVDKELNFFCDPDCGGRVDEYASFFDGRSPLRGESTPRYALDPMIPGVPERIRAMVPEARLIYLVRDPIARALGDYAQYAALWERISLDEAFRDLGDPYDRFTAPGLYAHQLERYLAVFPSEQILVVDQAELLGERQRTLREVFRFIGVDEEFASPRFDTLVNTTAQRRRPGYPWRRLRGSRLVGLIKRLPERPRELALRPARRLLSRPPLPVPDPSPELRVRLREAFADDVERLRELTGREFASWQL